MSVGLPPQSLRLVEATPLHKTKSGLKAAVEFTLYPDGHAGLAVCRIDGDPPNRRIVQVDSLPLNSATELKRILDAIVDHVEKYTGATED